MSTTTPAAPRVTVVVRARNEAADIGRVLDAVLAQDEPAHVLVIDSGSTDGTVDEVLRRPWVRLHRIAAADFTYGGACNLGMRLSETPYVAFLSAHARPADSTWLRRLLEPLDADSGVAGAYGRQLPRPDQDPLRARGQLGAFGDVPAVQRDDPRFSNASSVIRRTAWEDAPFDEALAGAEDVDWAVRQQRAGRAVAYAPASRVYHSHPETLRQVYRRHRQEGEGVVRGGEPVLRVRASVRGWAVASATDFLWLARHRHWRWLGWAPLYYAARFAGDWRGRRSALPSRGAS